MYTINSVIDKTAGVPAGTSWAHSTEITAEYLIVGSIAGSSSNRGIGKVEGWIIVNFIEGSNRG